MTTPDGFIELIDDRSDDAAHRIRAAKSLGLLSRCDQSPIWLGHTDGNSNDWHPSLRRGGPDAPPTVISFYTPDTAYEDLATTLRASCDCFGIAHRIEPRDARGSWERNCAIKAEFVLAMRSELAGPLLWVDADAAINAPLTDLARLDADFAVHLLDSWRALSGTIYFGDTQASRELIDRWHARCEAEPDIWDQIHLDLAWEDTARASNLRTAWLDERFVKIFDRAPDPDRPPVIVHSQASREHKHEVSGGLRGGEQQPTEDVRAARALSRWRNDPPRPSSESVIIAEPDDSAVRWQQSRIDALASAYQRCAALGMTRIALVGAGRHTREVALTVSSGHSIEIACILDDRAGEIESVDSVPVRAFTDCPDDIAALIISSDAHEARLAARCREALGDRVPIIEPYRDAAELSGTGSR